MFRPPVRRGVKGGLTPCLGVGDTLPSLNASTETCVARQLDGGLSVACGMAALGKAGSVAYEPFGDGHRNNATPEQRKRLHACY